MACSPVEATAAGGVEGGVSLVVREVPRGWSMELTRFHGPNVVLCEVVSGGQITPAHWGIPNPLDPVAPP